MLWRGLVSGVGIQNWPRRPKTRSSFPTRKGSRQLRATLSWMSGESRDLPHAAGAFDLFLGGLPQQTVASVDHRETPQQFDKMATADLYRDLLNPIASHRPHIRSLTQIRGWQNLTSDVKFCHRPSDRKSTEKTHKDLARTA